MLTPVPFLKGDNLERRFEDCLGGCHRKQCVVSVSVRGKLTLLVVDILYDGWRPLKLFGRIMSARLVV
jgi:hypothetical protein